MALLAGPDAISADSLMDLETD
jgi:hypothetical protein